MTHHTPTLADLARHLADSGTALEMAGDLGVDVQGVTLDSRRVTAGDLYAALPGSRAHGADHWAQAREGGAVAVLTDADGLARIGAGVPLLVVADPRRVLGTVAAEVYGRPADQLRMIGVTGTQGKTTTTRLVESGLTGAGLPAAVIGTVGTRILGEDVASALTTPEAPDLHRLLRRMVDAGVEACAMEVSSHALVMGRVDGVVFDVAVFLNLGRDHLDFHTDVEDYFQAKASLFTPGRARLGLVNVDDEHGRRLVTEATVPMRTFSAAGADADWRATEVDLHPDGSTFVVTGPEGETFAAGRPPPGGFHGGNPLARRGG